jgi:hypothetical protein
MGASSDRQIAEMEAEELLRDAAPKLLAALQEIRQLTTDTHIFHTADQAIFKATGEWP